MMMTCRRQRQRCRAGNEAASASLPGRQRAHADATLLRRLASMLRAAA